jgi:hypothetical protein
MALRNFAGAVLSDVQKRIVDRSKETVSSVIRQKAADYS